MHTNLGDSMLYRKTLTEEEFADHYGVNVITDLGSTYKRIWLMVSHCNGIPKKLRAWIREAGFIIRSKVYFKGIDVTIFGPS